MLSGQDAEAGVSYEVVYDSDIGWHVMKEGEDDSAWELVRIDSDGRGSWRALKPCYGPFFSNYDPNEGPTGSGKALAEEFAEEKRRLNPNGPVQKGQGS